MKGLTKVGIVVGALLLILLVWALFFNDGGILTTAYNTLADSVNGVWQSITGNSDAKIIPNWGGSDGVDYIEDDSGLGGGSFGG